MSTQVVPKPTRSGRAAVALVLTALGLVACGSASTGPTRSYDVVLRGVRGGFLPMSPTGSAAAEIRVFASRRVCWRFTRLDGITAPTRAQIHAGPAGAYGSVEVSLGARFSASGCTGPIAADQLRPIVNYPAVSYVELDTRAYPVTGAVRAQL
jgi:hypothetical protein